ncbi:MAG: hypothetical protein EAZ51_07280 [Sphingobacteriales bacterium]|nr:MAG: hypothetical protein EAZ64_02395 [Sphingobacteriales bacterium]TAF79787.1 MAG: hypothetical protein EAZ51_07280 [Sphingobacteriales bacterium]
MTFKQAAILNINSNKNLPICPNCYLPFKCRAKRGWLEKLFFGEQNFKKYWCEKCNSIFSIIEKKG